MGLKIGALKITTFLTEKFCLRLYRNLPQILVILNEQ
jgi:hypothetical protein